LSFTLDLTIRWLKNKVGLSIKFSAKQDMKRRAHETGEAAPIPITVRQLEAIVRLSESLAKMRL